MVLEWLLSSESTLCLAGLNRFRLEDLGARTRSVTLVHGLLLLLFLCIFHYPTSGIPPATVIVWDCSPSKYSTGRRRTSLIVPHRTSKTWPGVISGVIVKTIVRPCPTSRPKYSRCI